MNRRELIRTTLLAAGAVGSSRASTEAQKATGSPRNFRIAPLKNNGERMPNILWLCSDQQRADTLGGFNNDYVNTPNLRRLIDESVTCTNAFVQTPICSPSRASFLTGRYPHVTGLRANGQRIRPTERLVPRILADVGYCCGLIGKLHLSPCADGQVEQRIDDGYEVFRWSHDLEDDWPGQNQWLNWLARQGVQWPALPKKAARTKTWGVPIDPRFSHSAWCAEEAISFIQGKRSLRPWMLSVNFVDPHHPFAPCQEFLNHYQADKMPNPSYLEGELKSKPVFQRIDHQGAYGGTNKSFANETPEERRQTKAAYYAMIEQVDRAVGQILSALAESGQEDDTIVIFMSDHGEMLGDHGIYLKGPYFYDCLTRVPLIVRWPGRFKKGLKIDALVEMVDLAPTLLEATGIPVPTGVQGKSITDLLKGETAQHRDAVYSEYLDAQALFDPPPMATCLRTVNYKLAYYQGLRTGELYDLRGDPAETHNLWESANHKPIRAMMMELLADAMIATTDPLPQRLSLW